MSSSTTEETARVIFTAAVVTVSDSCARGERVDVSGPAVVEVLKKLGFRVVATRIVQDDSMQIQNALVHLALEVRFIVTTGGTGIAPRDVTPEATEAICDRLIDGVGAVSYTHLDVYKRQFAQRWNGSSWQRRNFSFFGRLFRRWQSGYARFAGRDARCRR